MSGPIKYYLMYTGIPINFGITVFLGFLVGTAIAGQTFYNFTIENLKQFGALKAMGATNLPDRGDDPAPGAGRGPARVTASGWAWPRPVRRKHWTAGAADELAFFTPWQLLPITAVAIILICILSSLLSRPRVIGSSRPSSSGAGGRLRSVGCHEQKLVHGARNVANPKPPDRPWTETDPASPSGSGAVTKHFGTGDQRVQALRGVDWDIFAGQMSLIVGPSGCGKTTLLSVIAGILDADEGEVSVFGRDITAMSDREKTRFRARATSASCSSSTTCCRP